MEHTKELCALYTELQNNNASNDRAREKKYTVLFTSNQAPGRSLKLWMTNAPTMQLHACMWL